MSARVVNLRRQWIPVAGGSCDVRMGYDALNQSSKVFKDSVGSVRACVVLSRETLGPEVEELVRRQLVDAGFCVCWHKLAAGASRTIDEANAIFEVFAREGINGEDLCCAIGDTDLLSLASYACGHWSGGVTLIAVPMGETAFFEGALVPRALDVGERAEMVRVSSCARRILLDYGLFLTEYESEDNAYARCLMVGSAMAGSERDFSELWDHAGAIASGDEEVTINQLIATGKARGQAISSTAAAVRQSVDYGRTFARALADVLPGQLRPSWLLSEGMRFAARLAVGLENLSIDDMLAQDELFETLGFDTASCCTVDPSRLVEAIREELSMRTNRMMLLVPFAIGRVRLATIPDDLLYEHVSAWCDAHMPYAE